MQDDNPPCHCTPGNYADDCPKHGSGVNIVCGETPRTDKAMWCLDCGPDGNGTPHDVVEASCARTLEKELNEAKAELLVMSIRYEGQKTLREYENDTTARYIADNEKLEAELATLRTALAAAEKAREQLKTERDGWRTSSVSWEELHAKRHEELTTATAALEAMTRERDEAKRAAEGYLQNAVPTGCPACAEGICCGSHVAWVEHKDCVHADLSTALASLKTAREALESIANLWGGTGQDYRKRAAEALAAITPTEQP